MATGLEAAGSVASAAGNCVSAAGSKEGALTAGFCDSFSVSDDVVADCELDDGLGEGDSSTGQVRFGWTFSEGIAPLDGPAGIVASKVWL